MVLSVSSPFSFLSSAPPVSLHPPTLWLLIIASLAFSIRKKKNHQMSYLQERLLSHPGRPAPTCLPCMPFPPYLNSLKPLWEFSQLVRSLSLTSTPRATLGPLGPPRHPSPACVCLTDLPLNSFLLSFHDPHLSKNPTSATHNKVSLPILSSCPPTSSLDSPAPGYHPPLPIKARKVLPKPNP